MGGRGLGEQSGHQDTRSVGLRFVRCWNEDVSVRMPRGWGQPWRLQARGVASRPAAPPPSGSASCSPAAGAGRLKPPEFILSQSRARCGQAGSLWG